MQPFGHAEQHALRDNGSLVKVFEPDLTTLQAHVLGLLAQPITAYRRSR